MKTMALLYRCIGVSGLNGIDRLLEFKIVVTMKNIIKMLNKEIDENTREIIIKSFHEVRNLTAFSDKYDKIYLNLRKQ